MSQNRIIQKVTVIQPDPNVFFNPWQIELSELSTVRHIALRPIPPLLSGAPARAELNLWLEVDPNRAAHTMWTVQLVRDNIMVKGEHLATTIMTDPNGELAGIHLYRLETVASVPS